MNGEKASPTLNTIVLRFATLLLLTIAFLVPLITAQEAPHLPELSRPVRSWEFLPVVGTRAGMFGDEAGHMEAWVYPLKVFRNLHLEFEAEGRTIPAETLARTINVRLAAVDFFAKPTVAALAERIGATAAPSAR